MITLRKLRRSANITQEELGASVGVTRQTIISWESGDTWPAAPMLPKLAKALGCSIDDLFREETAAQDEISMEGTA